MQRFPIVAAVWAALIAVGFAVVIMLGTPVPSAADELNTAMHPQPPVSQQDAEASAATIVRLGYPSFASAAHTTVMATDFGVEHWVVEYRDTSGGAPRGVRVSIVVSTGHVEVASYP